MDFSLKSLSEAFNDPEYSRATMKGYLLYSFILGTTADYVFQKC